MCPGVAANYLFFLAFLVFLAFLESALFPKSREKLERHRPVAVAPSSHKSRLGAESAVGASGTARFSKMRTVRPLSRTRWPGPQMIYSVRNAHKATHERVVLSVFMAQT